MAEIIAAVAPLADEITTRAAPESGGGAPPPGLEPGTCGLKVRSSTD